MMSCRELFGRETRYWTLYMAGMARLFPILITSVTAMACIKVYQALCRSQAHKVYLRSYILCMPTAAFRWSNQVFERALLAHL